ncbi:hypothetical protein RMCBS344292_16771 [Rhizopus microsporus]|nr:hypothetical protein RMCBS344292_16771 [Rhizopus microsporus]
MLLTVAFAHVEAKKWTTVGYVRKSVSKEGDATREKLLTAMITKLKEKLLCRKVFVSPFSSADKRDKSMKSSKFVESLKRDGTTQDLLLFLASKTRLVRLVAINYAGLSTNVEDVR